MKRAGENWLLTPPILPATFSSKNSWAARYGPDERITLFCKPADIGRLSLAVDTPESGACSSADRSDGGAADERKQVAGIGIGSRAAILEIKLHHRDIIILLVRRGR